ncbi:hypothetical protein [Pseudomonas sp. R5(2019)]|uniref:hypothetical protein n=1 Tax=Pseudomonas sp. R5(2019) TaxID=2697566 RepID=UPI0014130B0D|nr:hypothetical protein [Pseudomonas sp. R5(2019)]NBA93599.1 hypothetical protein [Pseudomonas sp. R5(2019)]
MAAMPIPRALMRCAFLLTLLGLSASCGLYNVPHRPVQPERVSASTAHAPGAGFDLQFIESDDQGWFWNPEQAVSALSTVKTATAEGNTLVVLFIHGWHHSAACYDDNVEAFKRVLQRLHVELDQKMYREAMPTVRVIGLYVGWRGRSLPGLIDYTTFWGRKSAARRVGEGDLQEFMARLQRIYNDHSDGRVTDGKQKPFFGLVSIGHSFGGAVLLAATSRYFESQMQLANPASGFLRTAPVIPTGSTAPTTSQSAKPAAINPPLRGFGDMVVLVNPAVESAAYERINILSRGITYGSDQTPLLVTFSAQNDGARNSWFKAGRIAGEFFTNAAPVHDDRERASLREALGVYNHGGSGITHSLTPIETQHLVSSQQDEAPDSQCTDKRPDTFEWWRWVDKPVSPDTPFPNDTINVKAADVRELASFDFSQDAKYSDLRLLPAKPVTAHQPFMVVSVNEQIIDGHTGIFSEPFMSFLTRYIGLTEAKRILLGTQASKR